VFLVKPPINKEWDMGDILAIARAEAKKLLKIHSNVRIMRLEYMPPWGFVAVADGCSRHAGCKHENKRNE